MATVNVTLYAGAYLDEADPDYELGKRAAYKMVVPIDDAAQATVDAEEGKALTLSGQAASSWSRAAGLVAGSGYVALASPPSGLTLSIGPVTPENVATGKRRISFSSTPPGASHATTWVGWATLGTVWEGEPTVNPGDIPADYTSPGTGLAVHRYANLSVSGSPALTIVQRPFFQAVGNDVMLPGASSATPISVSARGSFKIPSGGSYRFIVQSDDGCRMWVNGSIAVDDWVNQAAARYSGEFTFTTGQIVNVRVDNFNVGGDSTNPYSLWLMWSIDGAAYEDMPVTVMYPINWEKPILDIERPNQTAYGFDAVSRYT